MPRPQRVIVQVQSVEQAYAYMNMGYCYFAADEAASTAGDGIEVTNATLTVGGGAPVAGRSGAGHAEMAALAKYCQDHNITTYAAFPNDAVINCQSKPCCCHCSAILGILGVNASVGTCKIPVPMGSTQWGFGDNSGNLLAVLKLAGLDVTSPAIRNTLNEWGRRVPVAPVAQLP